MSPTKPIKPIKKFTPSAKFAKADKAPTTKKRGAKDFQEDNHRSYDNHTATAPKSYSKGSDSAQNRHSRAKIADPAISTEAPRSESHAISAAEFSTTKFSDLGLSDAVLQGLQAVGYEAPSPIQSACIPPLLSGADIIGMAQTGTGKTGAFALPLLSKINLSKNPAEGPQILVLTPTRELAIQVAEAFQTYAKFMTGFHVLPIYGGQSMTLQLRPLQRGVHVVIGTPGRIMDHIRRGTLKLSNLSTMVLDEADEMLKMGFIEDIEWIFDHTPATRQTALFSATMPPAIARVAQQYLKTPQEIKIKSATKTAVNTRQRYWLTTSLPKIDMLTRLLETEETMDGAIVFVRTKIETAMIAEKLEARGYSVAALSGDLTQQLRERVIEQLKKGQIDVVIATDVAARGLDVSRISHVINYDIPNDIESYIHRIGRTGRAGRTGEAILFVLPRERYLLRSIERATNQPIEQMQAPSLQVVTDKRVQSFKAEVLATLADQELAFFQGVVAELLQEHELSAEDLASVLLFMAQKNKPLQWPMKEEKADERYGMNPNPRNYSETGERGDRNDRGDRGRGQKFGKSERSYGDDKGRDRDSRPNRAPRKTSDGVLYRVDVGLAHDITPKNIVGALANEGEINIGAIGAISMFEDHATVELPPLSAGEQKKLGRIRVKQHLLNLRPLND